MSEVREPESSSRPSAFDNMVSNLNDQLMRKYNVVRQRDDAEGDAMIYAASRLISYNFKV